MGVILPKPLFWCSPSCRRQASEARPSRGSSGSLGAEGGNGDENGAAAGDEDPRQAAREWLKCQHQLGPCMRDLYEELAKADEEWLIDLQCEEMMNDEDLCLSEEYFNHLLRSIQRFFPKVEPPLPYVAFADKLRECYTVHTGEAVDSRGRGGTLACREVAQMYQQFVCTDFTRRLGRRRRAERAIGDSKCGAPSLPSFDGGYD